jgi:glyoxylase-like metal-dependent hydrolase (beta-lactamase superfamily II)
MIDVIRAENLRVLYIFLTHTHDDHVADLAKLAKATGAEVWSSEREPIAFPGAKTFHENAHFHVGELAIKTLSTWGHSPGQTTYYITGLAKPLAVVGDSLFSSSMGGSAGHYADQYRNDVEKILTLPRDTVLACGHGPLSTVVQEKLHNPFFAR